MAASSNLISAALPISGESREWVSHRDRTWARMDTPEQPMVVTIVLLLSAPLERERLQAILRDRLLPFARFRQRLVPDVPAGPRPAPTIEGYLSGQNSASRRGFG